MENVIEITVDGQRLHTETNNINAIAEGSLNFVTLEFVLDESWDDMTKFAHFFQNEKCYMSVLDPYNHVYMPNEIASGKCFLSLYGTNSGGSVRATSNCIELNISKSGIRFRETYLDESFYEMLLSRFIQFANPENIEVVKDSSYITDHDKIYIYIGNNFGDFKTGYWYYYDDSASGFVSGGAYASLVDGEFIAPKAKIGNVEDSFEDGSIIVQNNVKAGNNVEAQETVSAKNMTATENIIAGGDIYARGDDPVATLSDVRALSDSMYIFHGVLPTSVEYLKTLTDNGW